MTSGAYLAWAGPTIGNIIETPSDDTITGFGGRIFVNEGSSFTGTVYRLHSGFRNDLDVVALGSSPASTMVYICADSTGGTGVAGDRNFVANRLRATHLGRCGVFMRQGGLDGSIGVNGQAQVVTLNDFSNCIAMDVASRGISLDSWADTNIWSGVTRVSMTGQGSIGVIVNEFNPAVETGVYNTTFAKLAVDTFGDVGGRKGVVLGNSKAMYCHDYFNDPVAEAGSFIVAGCQSYKWTMKADNSNAIEDRQFDLSTTA